MPKKGTHKFSEEYLASVVARYSSLKEFMTKEPSVYVILKRRGLYSKCRKTHKSLACGFYGTLNIKQCTKLKDFREKYPSEYNAASRREDWKKKLYELLIHRKHCVTFNDEEKMKIIASCKTKRQLHDNYRPVYDWLRLANRLNEFYPERIDNKN